MSKILRIGTRGSRLALVQAETVAKVLGQVSSEEESQLVPITTKGDRSQDKPDTAVEDKKDWVLEIEQALVDGSIDLAVHSAKDVPVELHPETRVCSVLARVNAFDGYVLDTEKSEKCSSDLTGESYTMLAGVPEGGIVGTSSKRRCAQLLRLRPDLKIVPMRGNVPTRLRKLREQKEVNAIVLACAGMERLGFAEELTDVFSAQEMLPAVNQGILLVQYRKSREDIHRLLRSLVDSSTEICCLAERACIAGLGADCNSAVGVFAEIRQSELELSARVLSPNGVHCLEGRVQGSPASAEHLGIGLARSLLDQGAGELL